MKYSITPLALSLLMAASAYGQITVFDSSFTAGQGFADGGVSFGAPNPDTVIGQGGFSISDTAGVGLLNGPGTGFQRVLYGFGTSNGNVPLPTATVLGLGTGSTITVAATNLTFGAPVSNGTLMNFGLSNIDSGNIAGGSSGAIIGSLTTTDSTNINVSSSAGAFDAGVDIGDTFNYSIVFTAEGSQLFTIEQYINGTIVSTVTATGQAINFDKGNENTSGFIQDTGTGSTFTIDGLNLAYTAVPEPATVALSLGVACMFFAAIRRRRKS